MTGGLLAFVQMDLPLDAARAIGFFLIYIVVGLVPACGVLYVIYFLLTIPMRRKERARLLLDALELGLEQGQTPEATITNLATTREGSFGARFYLLAERVAEGETFTQATEGVPRFLPPEVVAMLRVGERIGNVRSILPACRQLLRDGVSQVRGALNYLILLVFAATPALVFVPIILSTRVLPKFLEVFSGVTGGRQLPALTRFVIGEQPLFVGLEIGVLLFLWLALLVYLGGPRLTDWIDHLAPGLVDRLVFLLPWRRKRLQRDFSCMVALLLDAEVAESEAVGMAAEAVKNRVMASRGAVVQQALRQGTKLPEAMAAMDDEGEFRWRLENAQHRRGGFTSALAGWNEALDAKAFQLEQSAAQTATTLLVLINGFVVGTLVVAIFLALIGITNDAVLW